MPDPVEIKVLVAHSDPLVSAGLCATLRKRRDLRVAVRNPESTVSRSTASHCFSPDVVVADYDSGLRLTALTDAWTDRVMILTHIHSEAKICHALEQGVRGYLLLGCGVEELIQGIRSMHSGGVALDPLVAGRIADCMKQEALTRREQGILGQMMLGPSNKKIASNLTLAVGTVKTYVKSILRKLDAGNRTEAVAIAQRRGISGRGAQMAPTAGARATELAGAIKCFETPPPNIGHSTPPSLPESTPLPDGGRGRNHGHADTCPQIGERQ
jgi:DNA-binding NarL/FixJ family response regulator